MICYLCSSNDAQCIKKGVRDNSQINVLKCKNCGLIYLSDQNQIDIQFYQNNGMEASLNVQKDIFSAGEITDTIKRFNYTYKYVANKRILDFGCGKGLFLDKLKKEKVAHSLFALEPNSKYNDYLKTNFNLYQSIDEIPDNSIDVITLFHVLEHLSDPIKILNSLYNKLADDGKIIIEVPSGNDALLNLYNCQNFANFTYWSCHLFLYNPETMKSLLSKTKYDILCVKQYQRYTIANHLHWLSKGKPAGHIDWGFLDDDTLNTNYANQLAEIGQCDSLLAIIQK